MTIIWLDPQGVILDVTQDGMKPANNNGDPIIGAIELRSPPNPEPTNRRQVWNFVTEQWGPGRLILTHRWIKQLMRKKLLPT